MRPESYRQKRAHLTAPVETDERDDAPDDDREDVHRGRDAKERADE